jgi:hypothetical protein
MSEKEPCQSCGLPIESGPYCPHCTNADGELYSFSETFARMVQFALRERELEDRDEAERVTLEYMRTMPAWSQHPELVARLG